MVEILEKIAQKRKENIEKLGFNFGFDIPLERKVPLCPPKFEQPPLLIAEIKRASPSAGHMDAIANPIELARNYIDSGAKVISILTEQDYFNGSLNDLMQVKNAFKNTTILRKDFIQFPEEVGISYLAGADMVLLIVAMFIQDRQKESVFKQILEECQKYSLTPLVEIHNEEELQFALKHNPKILGINSRNLRTFEIDKPKALWLKTKIPDGIYSIFESGIHSSFDGYMVGLWGFDGLLCGSYLVTSKDKNKNLANLIKSYAKGKKESKPAYQKIFQKLYESQTPLIKICGITNIDDALYVADLKADMIGFIMVDSSPRYCDIKTIKNIAKALNSLAPDILKVGIITQDKQSLIAARELIKEGILDCLQLHSIEASEPNIFASFSLKQADFPFYVCVNYQDLRDYPKDCIAPFVLLDSKGEKKGGNGKSIPIEKLKEFKQTGKPLFIAGGIGLENIDEILSLDPKMLDINSKIESSLGKKDKDKLKAMIQKIKAHQNISTTINKDSE